MKKIGIVYAISHAAGELCKKHIIENSTCCSEDILFHECPAESYKKAANDLQKIANLIIQSIELLEKQGAEVIIIAANSVHRAFDIVNEYIKNKYPHVELISIIDIAVKECAQNNYKKVAIFGSNSTVNSKMYHNKLNQSKIKVVELADDEQTFMNNLISSGCSPSTVKPDMMKNVIKIANNLKKSGCKAIVFACTELPFVFNTNNLNIPVVDTNLSLALAAIKKTHQKSIDND